MNLFRKDLPAYDPFPLSAVPNRELEKGDQELINNFFNASTEKTNQLLQEKSSQYWIKRGQQRALEVFWAAAERVPAYADFLKKNKINPKKIRSFTDFIQVPAVDKKNYLHVYPIDQLCWDGDLSKAEMISVSSGSSGQPFFWPRAGLLELETTYVQELYLKKIFKIDQRRTLYIDCFAMGMYIAGPVILNSALRVSQKGSAMTVMTPGLNMEDILRIIKNIGNHFDQIVLAGYPPYVKDIVDEATKIGFDWKKVKAKLIVAGEGFSENWRKYVTELIGNANEYTSIINLYGTADASIIGHETPTSVMLRKLADSDQKFRDDLLTNNYPTRLPTLVQYFPTQKYFENINDELHFTTSGGIPLVRYNIHDDGGVILFEDAMNKALDFGHDIPELIKQRTTDIPIWNLPFVYLYGRSDFTVVFYGANVYPENVKDALEMPELQQYLTGRFVVSIENKENQSPYLMLRLELKGDLVTNDQLENKIHASVLKTLLEKNDEFRTSYNAKKDDSLFVISLHEKGDERFFARSRNKQLWTKKA